MAEGSRLKLRHLKLLVVLVALHLQLGQGLDNGLALTPPMGWMTWERFRCNTDCTNDPDNCISEKLIMAQAKEMVRQGFVKAGYEYIIIDDCWLSKQRDPTTGLLQPDPKRFPSGIKQLASWVHQQGLKFGIYEDYGNFTCGGYPGILGHLEEDAKTLASWEVDYIKLDGCYADTSEMDKGYPEFGKYLNNTGRPIVYSCSWPAYQSGSMVPDYKSIAQHCNLWRNYYDIDDSYQSILSIVDWYSQHQDEFAQFAGPGHWNDPDMLIIGNFGLSYDQARTQMALWSVLASPLIMSNDLRTLHKEFRRLLLNRNAIRVNQDPLGIQGRHVLKIGKDVDIFVRPVLPMTADKAWKSAAVAVMNRGVYGTPSWVTFSPAQLGLENPNGYSLFEVFENKLISEKVSPDAEVKVIVNPTGVQFLMFKALDKGDTDNPINNDPSKPAVHLTAQKMGTSGWKNEL